MNDLKISNRLKIYTSLTAGALAGALAKTTIAPFDRCKINFQVSNRQFSYSAVVHFLIDTTEKEGILAHWRGNSATTCRVIPFAAGQFCAYEQWKSVLIVDAEVNKHTPFRRYAAGSLAGVTATTCTYPLDLARARLAVTQKAEYKNFLDVFVKSWKSGGVRSLWKGLSPTLAGVIPYAGSSFFTYETCKLYYQEYTERRENALERMFFGAFAGLVGQSTSYPLDIVRRRMQTSNSKENPGITKIMSMVMKEEGIIRGLYKGLSMNWIKGPIAVGISFTTYDAIVQFLRHLIYYKDCELAKYF